MKKLKKSKNHFSKSAIVFYVAGAISFMIFVYSMYSVQMYLNSLIETGQITWAANWIDMMGYYLGSSNGLTYLLFAFILIGIGYIISLIKKGCQLPNENANDIQDVISEPENESLEVISEDVETIQETREGHE